jgi:hypothetical protein
VNVEAAVHCCDSHLHWTRAAALDFDTPPGLPPTRSEQRTLRQAGTLQGVPPSCCGRRAAVWSGVCSSRLKGSEKRHDAQAACEPGGGGCGGVPVHPPRLHTHRTSPAQALLNHVDRDMLNPTPDLLSHCHRRMSGVHYRIVEG